MINMIVFGVLALIYFYQAGKFSPTEWKCLHWAYIITGVLCLLIYGASVYALVIGG